MEATQEQQERDRTASTNRWTIFIGGMTVLISAGLLYIGWMQHRTLADTLRLNRQVERAYVTLCHQPTGLHPDPNHPVAHLGGASPYIVMMEVRNCGNTPASVEHGDVMLVTRAGLTAPWITVSRGGCPGGFLVRNKHYRFPIVVMPSATDMALIAAGHMWLMGWLYYRDVFGIRRRAGYAVEPGRPLGSNNLTWDHDSTPNNYDVEVDENGNRKNT